MSFDVVETLQELIRRPSVNPMGRTVSGEIHYEHRVTDYLESLFHSLGLAYERFPVSPLRDNIIVRVDGAKSLQKGGKLLMLEAHQDTVPVDGMTIDPFDPKVEGGKIYGRGSCDIKGGMAAMLAALVRVASEKPRKRPTVVLACTVNEEHGFTGATHLANLFAGKSLDQQSKLLPRVPDAGIIAEPTQLGVVVAHKGAVRWRAHTQGMAAHSSQPHLGDNAIYHMARVLAGLEQYARDVVPHLAQHPLVGHPTLSVGLISGGISVNTVPDHCVIEIDRRVMPGDKPEDAYRHAVDYVNSYVPTGTPVVWDAPFLSSPGLSDANNGELAGKLSEAIKGQELPGECFGVSYGTNAPHYAAMGCPSVVFGPGSIDQAHTKDEWLEISQLEAASEILFNFIREGI